MDKQLPVAYGDEVRLVFLKGRRRRRTSLKGRQTSGLGHLSCVAALTPCNFRANMEVGGVTLHVMPSSFLPA